MLVSVRFWKSVRARVSRQVHTGLDGYGQLHWNTRIPQFSNVMFRWAVNQYEVCARFFIELRPPAVADRLPLSSFHNTRHDYMFTRSEEYYFAICMH